MAELDQAAAGKVTVITAPAGSGKSSLLRAWADRQDRQHRLAIVQVPRDQPDGQLFWLSLLTTVRRLSGEPIAADPPAAAPEFSAATAVERILEKLAEIPERVSLLIDDVHELTAPETFADLTRLLTDLPDHVSVILATRRNLPLRLHRLRLTGQLTDLRAADLRFSEDETRALLAASGITLSDAGVARLLERTEGWAAGLRLAVLSLTGHPDPERFVAEFGGSNRTVAEYLLAEMLERQPQDIQDLLLRTSILTRISGELADALTGRVGSEPILLDLEDANAFVVSLDAERTWFRYHHLFADLLQLELRRVHPDEGRGLHRRAADWFAEAGMTVEAIRHTQAAGDWSAAANLFSHHAFGMMLDGQLETMQSLLEAFPTGPAADLPALSVVRAMVDVWHGRLDEAAAHLAAAKAGPDPAPPSARAEAQISALELVLARRRGDVDTVLRLARVLAVSTTSAYACPPASACASAVEAGSDSESDFGTDSGSDSVSTSSSVSTSTSAAVSADELALGADLRVLVLMNLGIVEAWAGGLADGAEYLTHAVELARVIGRPYLEVTCLAQLAFATKLHSFAETRRVCEQAVALAARHGWDTAPVLAPALVTLACLQVFTGEFDHGQDTIDRAEEALFLDAGADIGLLHRTTKGMLHTAQGRLAEAEAEFAAAYDLQSQMRYPHALSGYVAGWLAAAKARRGSTDAARAVIDKLDATLFDSGEIRNARAVIALREGDVAGALAVVTPVTNGSASAVHATTLVEANALEALAYHRSGIPASAARAQEAVERALAAAEPERLILPLVMVGAGEVLDTVPRQRSAHASLLTDILDIIHGSAPAATASDLPAVPELSPTELRILRYLPTNMSRPQIAGELSVSVNTISTHVRSIYTKLQATDRASAVQRARELRLLAAGPSRQ